MATYRGTATLIVWNSLEHPIEFVGTTELGTGLMFWHGAAVCGRIPVDAERAEGRLRTGDREARCEFTVHLPSPESSSCALVIVGNGFEDPPF